MKSEEMRIGNYYDCNGRIEVVNPNTIAAVWTAERSWCKPIPLTEEWLLKFGLLQSNPEVIEGKTRFYGWIKGAFNLEIQDNGEIWFEVYSHYIHVKYVHQLQNLYFALTGKELTIEK